MRIIFLVVCGHCIFLEICGRMAMLFSVSKGTSLPTQECIPMPPNVPFNGGYSLPPGYSNQNSGPFLGTYNKRTTEKQYRVRCEADDLSTSQKGTGGLVPHVKVLTGT